MLYIMRHGKTDWNAEKRLQGSTDVPLNEIGLQMARDAAGDVARIPFDICFCSPLTRAKQTAQLALSLRPVPICYDDRLREMCFGIYEGRTLSDMPDSNMETFFRNPAAYRGENGAESFDSLFSRTGEFLKECVYPRLERGEHVLIVGHGAMNSAITCQVLGIPLAEFWSQGIENCKLKCLIR